MPRRETKINRNGRFYGMVVVLTLVVLAMMFLQKASDPPPPAWPALDNVPELGKVPTQEQIENRPPAERD